jgi:hypothetical protein
MFAQKNCFRRLSLRSCEIGGHVACMGDMRNKQISHFTFKDRNEIGIKRKLISNVTLFVLKLQRNPDKYNFYDRPPDFPTIKNEL